jgi:hypothetical protein
MMKQRDDERAKSLVNSPNNTSKRKIRSRLRHPKIAIPRKNHEVIRAFSINSDFEDDTSIFSREGMHMEGSSFAHEDPEYFRTEMNDEDERLDTPGFLTK